MVVKQYPAKDKHTSIRACNTIATKTVVPNLWATKTFSMGVIVDFRGYDSMGTVESLHEFEVAPLTSK